MLFSPRRELQPDLFVLPLKDGRRVEKFTDIGRLLLAVEVLSPSTAPYDRYKKRAAYQQEGVPEYWVVDPTARMIERWRPGDVEPEVALETFSWQPDGSQPPLDLALGVFFSEALD